MSVMQSMWAMLQIRMIIVYARALLVQSRQELRRFAKESGSLSVILASRDGEEVLSWHRVDQRDTQAIAPLLSGQFLAHTQLGELLGAARASTLITYELEEGMLLVQPLSSQLVLVSLVGTHRSTGVARLALRRLQRRLAVLLRPLDSFQLRLSDGR